MPARRKGRSNKGGDRRSEMTMQERYQDVKDFWLKQAPARQRDLLRVPIRLLLQGVTPAPACHPLVWQLALRSLCPLKCYVSACTVLLLW